MIKPLSRALACAIGLLLALPGTAQPLDYPPTRQVDHVDTYFGKAVADPYRWLEDDNAEDTRAWVQAQNRLSFGYLEKIPFRGAVQQRLKALADYPKYTAPFTHSGKVYFFKNDGLQNQSALYVQDGPDGKPELLLDPNTFSADSTLRLTQFSVSRDGRYAVVGKTAIAGSDWQSLQVMDLRTRQMLPEVLRWVKFSRVAWRGDGFYYNRYAEPAPGQALTARAINPKVYFHRIGTPAEDDTLVREDTARPTWGLWMMTTSDERHAVLATRDPARRGNQLFLRREPAGSEPAGPWMPLISEPGDDEFEAIDTLPVAGGADHLLMRTTRGAANGRLVRVDPARPAEDQWHTVIAERPEPLKDVTLVGGKLIASYLKDVTTQLWVFGTDGKPENQIALPAPGSVSGLQGRPGDAETYFSFTSLKHPPTLYRYEVAPRRTTVFRAPEIPRYDPEDYESRQVFFTSRDGTRVPLFLVHKKGLKTNGRNPTILYGYGGFNVTLNPTFSATRIAWLEQGGVWAQAGLRGGGEYGRAWHAAGMRLNKQNTFDDAIAAAEYLIAQRITSPERLAIQGGSNGGLLVGAVINQRPDLFKVALPAVGVMDMLRFQKFSAGVFWVADYGSSDDEAQFNYLLGYSPLHNIRPGAAYPATLVTTADHDDRVVPAHSFKYAATLQAKAGGKNPQLIRVETNSGHGASNLSKALETAADVYTFTWAQMGVVPSY